jgi:hypothetical protein
MKEGGCQKPKENTLKKKYKIKNVSGMKWRNEGSTRK